jgi:hypothetical protein
MTFLLIILTFTCPDGRIEETKITRRYPSQLELAMQEYSDYHDNIGTYRKTFDGQACVLTDIKGAHKKAKKVVK